MSGSDSPEPGVRVEYVTVDDAEGQALEERQLAVIREVLAWVRQDIASAPGAGPHEPRQQEAA